MKKTLLMSILLLGIALLPTFTINQVHAQAQPIPGDECSTPTQFLTITAGPGLKFDTDKLEANRATCVQVKLTNADNMIHDFTIDLISGNEGIASVYILLDAGESGTFNVLTPDVDKTFTFYCWQPGHRIAGMEGNFVVGKGSTEDESPGFGIWITFITFLSVGALIAKQRK